MTHRPNQSGHITCHSNKIFHSFINTLRDRREMGDQEIREDLHSDEQSADGRFSFTDISNSSRNRGLTGEHSSKAEEGWQTRTWTICYPPVHWKRHLLECFERRQLSAFPIALGVVNRNPTKPLFVHVFCVCQLPESYDSNMIQCDKRSLWYHFKCMNLRSDSTVPDTWYCSTCNSIFV